ncbi:heterotrimeric G protein alpha subunit 4 [Irpex lacteus]|nr:heterotrimeric G protein alpha subunit 4 [Irpex lacteus]
MGAWISSGPIKVAEKDMKLHREAERQLKEAKAKMGSQVKVLVLGSGDSGKSMILKKIRLSMGHHFPHKNNLIHGLERLLNAMIDMELEVSDDNQQYIWLIDAVQGVRDGQPYPQEYLEPLRKLWNDRNVQQCYERGNEAAMPDSLNYFFADLDRLFDPSYTPNEQDIVTANSITETVLRLREAEVLMVDVGAQKGERRKWIHCFQDVLCILFVVNLAGYDQCLAEDKDTNQLLDAMIIWDSICHSQWFARTSLILLLNNYDLFQKKIERSDIRIFFPDFDGEPRDAPAGRDYFRKRFARLAQNSNQKGREIYIHRKKAPLPLAF